MGEEAKTEVREICDDCGKVKGRIEGDRIVVRHTCFARSFAVDHDLNVSIDDAIFVEGPS